MSPQVPRYAGAHQVPGRERKIVEKKAALGLYHRDVVVLVGREARKHAKVKIAPNSMYCMCPVERDTLSGPNPDHSWVGKGIT